MVHSADSRIQGHAFRCHLFSPAVSDHASTNLRHHSALGETPSETMLDDQGAPKPQSVRLDMLLDPLFASGSERAEQENCALIANQYVRSIRDNLRRTAHGCVLLSSNTHQVTKIEKAPSLSGAVVETVCTLCHIRLSAYHRSSPNVGWSRFHAVLMLTAIVPSSAIGWNGTKVGSVIHRDLISKISGQNKT